jgi:uncharacterized phage protein gp47/JayE
MIYPKNYNQIIVESLAYLQNTELSQAQSPNSIAGALMRILASYQVDLQGLIRDGILAGILDQATGVDLDRIGTLLGLSRSAATRALDYSTTNVKFYIDPFVNRTAAELISLIPSSILPGTPPAFNRGSGEIYIFSGTRITKPNSSISYRTTEQATLTGTEIGVPVVADGLGASFNVAPGTLTQSNLLDNQTSLSSISEYILCTNTADIMSGADTENDDNYRYLLSQRVMSAQAANETAIRVAALSVPGVSDVRLRRWTNGIGTFSVYIISQTPVVTKGLLNAVTAAVQSAVAYPEKATITGPEYLGIKLRLGLSFLPTASTSERASLLSQVQTVTIDYINNLPLGGQLIVNEIIQRAMDASEKILDVTISDMQLGEFNVELNRLEHIQPIIVSNQKAAEHQKFYTTYALCHVC